MAQTYVMAKFTNKVGVADLPDFVDFNESPPRSFAVWWQDSHTSSRTSTEHCVRITKEVADIIRGII